MSFQSFVDTNSNINKVPYEYLSQGPQVSLFTCEERPDLIQPSIELEDEVWDRLSFLDFTPAHAAYYNTLIDRHPDYRLCLVHNETDAVIATGMCVPIKADLNQDLPDGGWDWVVSSSFEQQGRNSNLIGALSISVTPEYRKSGYARDLINTMRNLAAYKKLNGVIAPVRPSSKCHYPFVSMYDYIDWQDTQGQVFDPWLRSHLAAGGTMHKVCDHSMVVDQELAFWTPWISDVTEGYMKLPGGLSPLKIDIARNNGRYVEPNVWVQHLL